MDARGLEEALRALVLEDVAPLSCVKAMAMVGVDAYAVVNGSDTGQVHNILRAVPMPKT